MSLDQASTGYWEDAPLDCKNGPQPARRFVHPLRQGIPELYMLLHPHPLRRMTLDPPENEHPPSRIPIDYVILIRKAPGFMREWRNAGEKVESPTDDVTSNQEKGTHLSLLLPVEASSDAHARRMGIHRGGRHGLGSRHGWVEGPYGRCYPLVFHQLVRLHFQSLYLKVPNH